MKETPIIFSTSMVRALLSGAKIQTRRIATDQTGKIKSGHAYGVAGDILWVKEAWRTLTIYNNLKPSLLPADAPVEYRADVNINSIQGIAEKWRTPLFMLKDFSRLRLEIMNLRYQRLLECSQDDAIAEGIAPINSDPMMQYQKAWESIHGAGAWNTNPWVWVIEFKICS